MRNNFVKFILKQTTIFFSIFLFLSSQILASNTQVETLEEQKLVNENEKDINFQLNSYKSVSKWIIDNQDKFQQVLKETARKSKTKWIQNTKKIEDFNKPVLPQTISTGNKSQEFIHHEVKAKETVYSIAKMYGIEPSELIKLNNLSEEGFIYEGQNLIIKIIKQDETVVNNLSPLDSNLENNTFENGAFQYPMYKYYQVEPGDTIYSISRAVNMTPQEIISLNSLENMNIYPGMILKINAYYQEHQNNKGKFDWPLVGRLLISFGPQRSGMISEGINIMAKKGANVKSVADGVVIYVGNGVKALGNLVLIQHQDGWVSVYGYLDDIEVKKGQEIKKGMIIAKVGKPSSIKVPQLHFELRQNVTPKDPLEYLNSYT